jgi:hypothetical protein
MGVSLEQLVLENAEGLSILVEGNDNRKCHHAAPDRNAVLRQE